MMSHHRSSLITDAILPPNHQFPAKSMPRGSAIGEEREKSMTIGEVGLNATARSQRPALNPASATFPEQLSPSQRVMVF